MLKHKDEQDNNTWVLTYACEDQSCDITVTIQVKDSTYGEMAEVVDFDREEWSLGF